MSSRDIFDSKGKFLPAALATIASVNVGVGPDGDFWSYRNGLWSPDPDIVHKACVKNLGNEYTRTRANNVADIVRLRPSTPPIPATPNGANKWFPWITLQNVEYNWINDEVEAHSPAALSTVQLNVTWDMAAECPLFDSWVSQVIPHDMLELFWEVLGYCLMTGNPKQTAILIFGPGGTGKSTFLRVLEHMLGRQNIATESLRSLTENRFSVANLFGKVANIQGDIDAAYMKDSSVFKALTGGDTMNAEYKGKTAFSFEPFATPIFSANKVWRSSDDTDGYFRRWTILPFLRKVDRSKPFDEEALYLEASGIFNKAMGALRDMYERTEPKQLASGEIVYESARDFSSSASAREAVAQFQQDSDPLRMWIADDDRVTTDRGNDGMRTDRSMFYKTYQNWCYTNGMTPKTAPEFYKSVTALGFPMRKSGNNRFILGVMVTLADSEAFV